MTFIDWIYHKINKHRRNWREKREKENKNKNKNDDNLNKMNKIIAIAEYKNF